MTKSILLGIGWLMLCCFGFMFQKTVHFLAVFLKETADGSVGFASVYAFFGRKYELTGWAVFLAPVIWMVLALGAAFAAFFLSARRT